MTANSTHEKWAVAVAEAQTKFNQIAVADGSHVLWERESMYALQSILKSDYLQKCDLVSIRNAIVNVASVGLSLNPAMKLAYLVPREGVACLDISYIGLVKLATDSGGVLAVSAILVHANDKFEYRGPFDMPCHTFNPFASEADRGELVGVYVAARLPSGIQIDTLSLEEINKIRSKSRAKSGPWFDWFGEMVKKSAIKRASKMWPRTERLAAAEAILNEHEGIDFAEPVIEKIVEEVRVEYYPEASFKENLPKWLALIDSGKRTVEEIIATVEAKAPLSDTQKRKIKRQEEPK